MADENRTTTDGMAVLRRYADKAIRFYEAGYQGRRQGDPENCMIVGIVIEGGFGAGDDLFDVFRALRREDIENDQ